MAKSKSTSKRSKKPILKPKRKKPIAVDGISDLPDFVLSHILAFLTTKDAVATSILSNRWKTLWTLVPNLDFDDYELGFLRISSSLPSYPIWRRPSPLPLLKRYRFTFAHIVSRVWSLRNANPNPPKMFRLRWQNDCDPIHLDTWLRTAITRGFEVLDLDIYLPLPDYFTLPFTLFNYCKTLAVLKLAGSIVLDPPSSSAMGFPSLKVLHLHLVEYANPDSFSRLLSCCPVLQDLSVEILGREDGENNFKIVVRTLKRLQFSIHIPNYKLEINAPCLEYLYFIGNIGKYVLLGNLSNLVEAVLETSDSYCLCNAIDFDDPPMFPKLAHLNFGYGHHCLMENVLPLLLHRAPKLVVLIFDKKWSKCCGDEEKDCFSLEKMFCEDIPECLSSHLRTFHFQGFHRIKDELELIRRILKCAGVLKTMSVSSYPLTSQGKVYVLNELLKFPRLSSTCRIAFN
nr:FBD-associated F-box protein At3g52670-like isoform X2 [Quercus suber]